MSEAAIGPGDIVGFWETPSTLADRVAAWADVRGQRVIDLGAGTGRLSAAVHAAGADAVLAYDLEGALPWRVDGVEREACDVLDRAAPIPSAWADVVVTNPPWEGRGPIEFLRRALELAPRVVAIVPINTLCGAARCRDLWTHVRQTREARLACRPSFGRGKNGMRDVVLVELVRRREPRLSGEQDSVAVAYWPDRWA